MQIVPATQVPDPLQYTPPHWAYLASVPPEPELVVLAVAVPVAVVEVVNVVNIIVVGVAVAVPPRRLMTEAYAGFVVKSAFHKHASPC